MSTRDGAEDGQPPDWRKMFSRLMVPDTIDGLRSLHKAILTWRDTADAEFSQSRDCAPNPAWDEFGYDPLENEAVMLLLTERAMFACLGVSIAATAENFVKAVAGREGIPLCREDGEPHQYGTISQQLGQRLGVAIHELEGYKHNQRARLLGNCFKHSEGKTDGRFTAKFGGDEGIDIEYEKEDWNGMIDGTEASLLALVDRLE